MKPPLPICHLSCTFALQHDHFDPLLPTFLLNPVSELHLFLVASDLPNTNLELPNHIKLAPSFSSFRSRLKTYLFILQLVNNWPPSELFTPLDSTSYSILRALQMFLNYITLYNYNYSSANKQFARCVLHLVKGANVTIKQVSPLVDSKVVCMPVCVFYVL